VVGGDQSPIYGGSLDHLPVDVTAQRLTAAAKVPPVAHDT
jgi:hypothetical protein